MTELVLLLTVCGVVGWHVTHASRWWSRPVFRLPGKTGFSDRRHLWSWLSYWPICGWVIYLRAGVPWGSWEAAGYWVGVLVASKLVWSAGKALAGKRWSWIGVQLWESLRRGGRGR